MKRGETRLQEKETAVVSSVTMQEKIEMTATRKSAHVSSVATEERRGGLEKRAASGEPVGEERAGYRS